MLYIDINNKKYFPLSDKTAISCIKQTIKRGVYIMLTENKVVLYVAKYLKNRGYDVYSLADTNTQGIDIKAKNNDHEIWVEAKGQTSSKEGTNRYGKEFTRGQKKDHISVAIYKIMEILNCWEINKTPNNKAYIALPYDKVHLDLISSIALSLKNASIGIFWVKENGEVIDDMDCSYIPPKCSAIKKAITIEDLDI